MRHIKPFTINGIEKNSPPHKYFEATLPQSFFDHLVEQTNSVHKSPRQCGLTLQHLFKWLALTIVLMLEGLSSYKTLFRTEGITINFDNKSQSLGRDRWVWINSHLEFDDKIVHSILTETWQSRLTPGTYLTCDESRMQAHPRDESLLSFNKDKPERWAFESHTLHDTATSYLLNFDLPKSQTAFQALVTLPSYLAHKDKHHITADKHFSNLDQLWKLAEQGFCCTLNCKKNAQPGDLWKKGLEVGLPQHRSRWAEMDGVTAACFYNRGVLHLLSNFLIVNDGGKSSAAERRIFLEHYDNTKRAADQFNNYVSKFHNHHSHAQQSHSFLNGLLEWGLTNGYILYKYNTSKPLSHRKYLYQISQYLLNK